MQRSLIRIFSLLMLLVPFGAQAQEFPPAQPALDFIAEHPQAVAVLCYTTNAATPEFELNADEPFPLASTYKLVILAELARQVDAGLIDPAEQISLSEVNAYWLPPTDGNMHQMWLDSLDEAQETVTLQEVVNAMIRLSSNAAADYLLSRLDKDRFSELFDDLGLANTDLPAGGYLGLYLAMGNHETGISDPESLDIETWMAERERLETLFLTDAAWREAELNYQMDRIDALTKADEAAVTAEIERQAAYFERFGMKGSARDMLRILDAAYSDDFFGGEGQTFIQSSMDWLMEINPANAEVYEHLGTKGGTWVGILTGVWYAKPRSGNSISLAVFYRDMPFDLWSQWATHYVHQGLELRAIASDQGCGVFG